MEALDIALLLTGIGEIKAAVSVGRFILAASNIILGSGNIVVRSFGHELPEGWVQSWHSISEKIITFQLLELGLTGIFNARKLLIGLRQTAATVANVAKHTLLQMIDVCEQLLELSERILTTFDELWLSNLLTDLEASMLEFAEYGSLAYFNLKAAIENRLALLKERAARMAAPKPYEESQLTYKQEGNIEYLDVNLGGGMVVKLKRVDGGEWIVSGSKAPPEMYNRGKPMPKWPRNEEVLGRLPERYRKPKTDAGKSGGEKERGFDENNDSNKTNNKENPENKPSDWSDDLGNHVLTEDPFSATNVREAEDWAMQYLGIEEVSYIGMSRDMAVQYNKHLYALIGKYKHFKLNRIFVDSEEMAEIGRTTLYVQFNNRTFGIVHFSKETELFNAYNNTVLSQVDGVAQRIWSHFPEEMLLQVEITHEFGHLVQWDLHVMADAGDLMAAKVADEFIEIMTNLTKEETEQISKYADVGTKERYNKTRFQFSEAFAESFSVYVNGKGSEVLPAPLYNYFENSLMPFITVNP